MLTLFDAINVFFSDALGLVLLCTLKAALILAAAGVVVATLRDASAAVRHWVWALGLGGVLLVTVLTLAGPSWEVLPLNGPDGFAAKAPATTEASEAASAAPAPMTGSPASPLRTFESSPPAFRTSADAPHTGSALLGWAGVLLAYGVGVLLVLMYFAIGTLRAQRWSRQAEPVTDYALLKQADALGDELGLAHPVRLLWSNRAVMPVTWGFTRPVLLLPRRAAAWCEERRRVVLLHEMAHIRRRDGLTQSAAQLVCALHWFNPLVWWAARRMRIERERACDDVVLKRGAKASSYADHLLHIARSCTATPGQPIGATSMARKSQLERRLLAILDADKRRQALGRLRVAGSAVLVAALLVPLAALRPAPASVPAGTTASSSTASGSSDLALPPPPSKAAPPAPTAKGDPDAIRRSFDVAPGGTFSLDSDLGSVEIGTHDAHTVKVVVRRKASDPDDAKRFDVRFEQHGDDVRVRGEKDAGDDGWFSSWNGNDLEVSYTITVPRRYNTDLQTAGGSIRIADLEGEVNAKTAGGSLRLGNIRGAVQGQTAGGSIRLDGSTGDARLKTAGGSIRAGDVDGNMHAKTAGGSIKLGRVSGTVYAKTAGGSIHVEEVGGQIDAKTAGGSITARITKQPQGDSHLSTSAGSVTVYLAEGVGVDLDAEASFGHITSDFHEQRGDKDESDLKGAVNGGGPELRLRASVGNIEIHRLGSSKSEARSPRRRMEREHLASWSARARQATADALQASLRSASERARDAAWSTVRPLTREIIPVLRDRLGIAASRVLASYDGR